MEVDPNIAKIRAKLGSYDWCAVPIGTFAVTKAGDFVECNQRAREILGFPKEGPIVDNIARYYLNPADREILIDFIEMKQVYEGRTVCFLINGRQIWVQISCRAINDEAGATIGYINCIADVDEEQSFTQLYDESKAGAYRLDADNKIIRVNQTFANMFGYDNVKDMIGLPAEQFYMDKKEASVLLEKVMKSGSVVNVKGEFRRKDGDTLIAVRNTQVRKNLNGSYAGCEGTIADITKEETYRHLVEGVPLGTYMVRHDASGDTIINCNGAFAAIFGFSSTAVAMGKDFRWLYDPTSKAFSEHQELMYKAYKQGRPVLGHHAKMRAMNGQARTIEISSRFMPGNSGKIMWAGVVRDVSGDVALHQLKRDIGTMLHAYLGTLFEMSHSLRSFLHVLGSNPFNTKRTLEIKDALEILRKPAGLLADELRSLIQSARHGDAYIPVEEGDMEQWLHWEEMLRKHTWELSLYEIQLSTIHEIAVSVTDVCRRIRRSGKYHREAIIAIERSAIDLERIIAVIRIYQIENSIVEMDHDLRSFREQVVFRTDVPVKKSDCVVHTLISMAAQNLEAYASLKGVEIRRSDRTRDVHVYVCQRAVVRALTNLLHNAIKYSWERRDDSLRWVGVRSREEDGQIVIDFENYGVGIPADEIKDGSIFELGYRGRWSTDRMRYGTGIGLAYAMEVAEDEGGGLSAESQLAHRFDTVDDKSKPYITIVRFGLPRYIERKHDEKKA